MSFTDRPASRAPVRAAGKFRRAFCAEHPDIFHYEVEHAHQVGEALKTIARVHPKVLVINGGDGTVQAALTELYNGGHFGTSPPPVAVLPSGKTNLIALDLGAFVQATILDPATGALQVYEPLVITQGTTPAAAPAAPGRAGGSLPGRAGGRGAADPAAPGARDGHGPDGPGVGSPLFDDAAAQVAASAQARDLAVVSWGGAYQDAQKKVYFEPFKKASGVAMNDESWDGGIGVLSTRRGEGV